MKHHTIDQCAHTFDITHRQCRACNGQNKACRCYETRPQMKARLAEKEKSNGRTEHL